MFISERGLWFAFVVPQGMARQIPVPHSICGVHLFKAHRRPYQPHVRFAASEGSQLLHLVTEGEVQRLHDNRSGPRPPAAQCGQDPRVRTFMEGHSPQLEGSFSHFHW